MAACEELSSSLGPVLLLHDPISDSENRELHMGTVAGRHGAFFTMSYFSQLFCSSVLCRRHSQWQQASVRKTVASRCISGWLQKNPTLSLSWVAVSLWIPCLPPMPPPLCTTLLSWEVWVLWLFTQPRSLCDSTKSFCIYCFVITMGGVDKLK